MFKHGFLFFGFEELLIDDFDADEFSIFSVDSNVGITGHTATEFLLEWEFELIEFFYHGYGDVVIVGRERREIMHSLGFVGFFGFEYRTF